MAALLLIVIGVALAIAQPGDLGGTSQKTSAALSSSSSATSSPAASATESSSSTAASESSAPGTASTPSSAPSSSATPSTTTGGGATSTTVGGSGLGTPGAAQADQTTAATGGVSMIAPGLALIALAFVLRRARQRAVGR